MTKRAESSSATNSWNPVFRITSEHLDLIANGERSSALRNAFPQCAHSAGMRSYLAITRLP